MDHAQDPARSDAAVTSGQPAEPLPGDYMSIAAPRPWAAWDRGIGWEVNDATGEPINNGFRETYCQADARLIAAAPELLAALKDCIATLEICEALGSEIAANDLAAARAAIVKAEGK